MPGGNSALTKSPEGIGNGRYCVLILCMTNYLCLWVPQPGCSDLVKWHVVIVVKKGCCIADVSKSEPCRLSDLYL